MEVRNEAQIGPVGMKRRDSAGHQMLNPSVMCRLVAAMIFVKHDPEGTMKKTHLHKSL